MTADSAIRYLVLGGFLAALWHPRAALADLGVPISPPKPLNANAGTDTSGDSTAAIATDGNGLWIGAWATFGTPRDIVFARSIDNGENWSFPLSLKAAGNVFVPSIATDGQGHWVVVWNSDDTIGGTIGADDDIIVVRSADNGQTWSSPAPLNNNAANDTGNDTNPRIATDGSGHWIVVWSSNDTLGGTIGTDQDILVARSIDNGANWSSPIPLNHYAGVDVSGDTDADIATDGKGNWIAVWDSTDSLGNTIGTEYDILAARSVDNGAHWSNAFALNTDAGSDSVEDGYPRIACDQAGNCVAVWAAFANGVPSFIRAAGSTNAGANWSDPVELNPGAGSDDAYPHVATDGLGDWVAGWEFSDPQGGAPRTGVLVSRSIDTGVHWSLPAPLKANAATDTVFETDAQVAADGHGNWVTAWRSNDSLGSTIGTDTDILTAQFALPDCNANLIADSSEVLLGLLPDINFNGVPDICEIINGPAPVQPGGCGVGFCGAGAPAFVPLTLFGVTLLRRSHRRRHLEKSHD